MISIASLDVKFSHVVDASCTAIVLYRHHVALGMSHGYIVIVCGEDRLPWGPVHCLSTYHLGSTSTQFHNSGPWTEGTEGSE